MIIDTKGREILVDTQGNDVELSGAGVAVSAGAASQSTGTVIFSNSNGVSFGLNAGTLTASAAAGAGIAAAAGTQTAGTGTVVFANSNGLTFGMSGSSQITASHNALTTAAQSNQVVNSLNGSTGQISLATGSSLSSSQNGSTITFGLASNITTALQSAGAYLTTAANSTHTHGSGPSITGPISVTSNSSAWSISISNYLTTARASNDAVGLNTAATSVTWTVNSSGISLNAGAYLTTAANSTHSHGNPTLALTNLTGTTASASNGLTISLSAAAPGAGGGFAAQGSGAYTQNTGTIQFANSNGITFGLSTNQMTASVNSTSNVGLGTALTAGPLAWTVNSGGISLNAGSAAGTSSGFAGANISLSMTHNTAGLNISASVAAPGAAAEANWINLSGNTAGNTTASGSTIKWYGGANITLQATNGSEVSIIGGGGGAGATLSYFEPRWAQSGRATNSSLGQNTLYFMPFDLPFYLSASRINFYISISGAMTAANSTGTCRQGFGYALYTRDMTGAASQTLSLLTSYSLTHLSHSFSSNTAYAATHYFGLSNATSHSTRQTGLSTSNATTYLSTNLNGPRVLALPLNLSMTPGRYWLAVAVSTVTGNGMTNGLSVQMTSIGVVGGAYHFGSASAATNASVFRAQQGWGSYSATSAAFPNSVAYSTDAIRHPVAMTAVHFDIRGFGTSTNQL